MSSINQLHANRLNAQHSTGPRSVNGKAAARMNAFKSGLYAKLQVVKGESAADLEALKAEYHGHYRPATPAERALVDELVNAEWLKRRFRVIEAQLMTRAMDSTFFDEKNPVGYAYDRCDSTLARLQRRIDSTDRLYHRALAALTQLQSARPLPAAGPIPIKSTSEPKLASFRQLSPKPPKSAQEPAAQPTPSPQTGPEPERF